MLNIPSHLQASQLKGHTNPQVVIISWASIVMDGTTHLS